MNIKQTNMGNEQLNFNMYNNLGRGSFNNTNNSCGNDVENSFINSEVNYGKSCFNNSSNYQQGNKKCIENLCISSAGVVNGFYLDKYGKRGNYKIKNMPICSIPVQWSCGPCGTCSYALTLIDHDAIPVVGFSWIHWLVANIPYNVNCLSENASRNSNNMIEGLTSFGEEYQVKLTDISDFRVPNKYAIGYGGFAPPDNAHKYTLKVYALCEMLNLKRGFTYNQLVNEMESKVLGEGTFTAFYKG